MLVQGPIPSEEFDCEFGFDFEPAFEEFVTFVFVLVHGFEHVRFVFVIALFVLDTEFLLELDPDPGTRR